MKVLPRTAIIFAFVLSLYFTGRGYASESRQLTVHCSSVCKVYIDGKLAVAVQSDSIRVVNLSSGKHTIVITRPGKTTWTHGIAGDDSFFADPDEAEPHAIANVKPAKDAKPSATADAIPSSLQGYWVASGNRLPIEVREGSLSCPVDLSYGTDLIIVAGVSPQINYSRNIELRVKVDYSDDCLRLRDSKSRQEDNEWGISFVAPITFTNQDNDSAMFTGNMSDCRENCDFPPAIKSASGTITRSGSRLKLVWGGDLAREVDQYFVKIQ